MMEECSLCLEGVRFDKKVVVCNKKGEDQRTRVCNLLGGSGWGGCCYFEFYVGCPRFVQSMQWGQAIREEDRSERVRRSHM